MLESKAYQIYYAFSSGEKAPKPKYIRKKADSDTSPKKKPVQATKGTRLQSKAKVSKLDKKKQPAKKTKAKGLDVLSEIALTEAEQIKLATKRSKKDFHGSHASGLNEDDNGDAGDDGDNDHDGDDSDDHDDDRNDDTEMTNADQGASEQQNVSQESGFEQEEEDAHLVNLETPSPADNEIASLLETSAHHATTIPEIKFGFTTTTPPQPPFFNPIQQQKPTFTTTTSTNPTVTLPEIPNFASVFKFDQRVSTLDSEMSEFKQTNQYAEAVSSIPRIVDTYLASKMKEVVDVSVQLQTNKLREEAQAENQEFLNQVDSTMKTIIKDQVKVQVSKIMLKIEKRKSGKDAESSKDSRSKEKKSSSTSKDASQSKHKSSGKSVHAEEPSHTVKDSGMQQDQELVTEDNDEQLADKEVTKADWFKKPEQPPTPDPDWKLEYHLEECSKATSERLDWHNPKKTGGDLSRRYSTSVMKIKAATYELKWIKDLVQELWSLGVKLNVTKLDTYRSNLKNKTAYTSHSDPHGIIYVDQFKRKRLMQIDELHKFSDGTLNDVRTALHDIAAGIRMEYLPTRKWSNLDKKRARVMVQDIDK
ncbi:hypothetical protein Tco_0718144 [Tanacetum coccineum]